MRRSAWPLAVLAAHVALASCDRPTKSESTRPELPTTSRHLGEWFDVSSEHRCRVSSAQLVATEPREVAEGHVVPEDLLVIAAHLECQDHTERARSLDEALPDDAIVLLEALDGSKRAPSLRTRESARSPDALVFEIPRDLDVVVTPRRFDAKTGDTRGRHERGVGTLHLALRDRQVDVVLAQRIQTARLDAFAQAFARMLAAGREDATLAHGESGRRALRDVLALHAAIQKRFAPRILAMDHVDVGDDVISVTFGYDESWVRDAPRPLAPFTIVLTRATDDALTVEKLVDARSALEDVECADAVLGITSRVEQAFSTPHPEASCNVLGVLLPNACDGVDAALAADVLRVRARCAGGALDSLDDEPARLPEDFQITVRRGETSTGLDRTPRYVLALFGNGSVVFHGKHWVSTTGRSDGRTTPTLLGRLYASLLRMEWFDRKGGEWDKERCAPDDERGNVITLHAGERERMVLDRDGCRGPFSAGELAQVLDWAEAVGGVAGWTSPRPSYADPGLQVWTIPSE